MNVDERKHAQDSLRILDGIVLAMAWREEVFHIIEDSEDHNEALVRLAELLELDEICCRAILDMQFRRLTRDVRRAIAEQAEELRSALLRDDTPATD